MIWTDVNIAEIILIVVVALVLIVLCFHAGYIVGRLAERGKVPPVTETIVEAVKKRPQPAADPWDALRIDRPDNAESIPTIS